MEWLGRKLYPRALPHERRSRMEMLYLLMAAIFFIALAVAGGLWALNEQMQK